ncbi:beta-glucosidase 1 [Physcia stellaris]|nr:beta-glucosidase 1 [Physcia stellaris]
MWLTPLLLVAAGLVNAQDGNTTAPFPNATYSDATSPDPAAAESTARASSLPFYPSPWGSGSGPWADAYAKAQAFVSQLTLTEKVNLTTGVGWEGERCVGQNGAVPRLGFRSMSDFNSVFPAGVNVAATFDRGLAYARGQAMGAEHRGKGVDVQLGPVAGPLGRSPEGGRNWEGFSPDPVLTGIMMAQTIEGIQDAGVIACAKHYIGNEQEHFRQVPESAGFGFNISDSLSSNIDDRTMHELYLWPFADAVRANNSYTLNYLLKGELDFQGFVMSDWQAQHSGVGSALAGMDMSMPGDVLFDTGTTFWGTNLTVAILNGTVPEWRLNDMATRIIAAWYYVGRDNTSVPINFDSWTLDTFGNQHFFAKEGYGLINEHVDVRAEHGNLIRQIGSASTVLLKNTNNALPLAGKEKLTAVFGNDAGGNPNGPNGCSDRGCDNGTLALAWGSGTANFPYLVTPETAIQNEVLNNMGAFESITDNFASTQIAVLASRASVAIVFVNADSGEGYLDVDGNIGDRNNLTLWQGGDTLVQNVSALCNNTVVVIHSVGPVLLSNYSDNPNITAILWAGLPGEQSGNSIADVLYGRYNPGAKLPFTMAASREDYGTDLLYIPNEGTDAPQVSFTEGVFIDYRSLDQAEIQPVYEFGYGLSYTTFAYSNLQVNRRATGTYTPTTGTTAAAPIFASSPKDASDYLFPSNITRIPLYIYPYLNSTDLETSANETFYGLEVSLPAGSQDGSPQPRIAAGGAPGGNPQLYDVLYQIDASVTNTGTIPGEEVAQLYISLGGPYDPKVMLRGFQRLSIQPNMTANFHVDITRRDISNWDSATQNWVISNYTKTVHVGTSSRKFFLNATLS